MRIAIIFRRFGPYHHARIKAVATGGDVVAIEMCRRDGIYQWENVSQCHDFKQVTVFTEEDAAEVSLARFRKELHRSLDGAQPHVVAIPGWSDREAIVAIEWCIQYRIPIVVLSESNAQDRSRNVLSETIKARLLSTVNAAVVGGKSGKSYIITLGFSSDRIFQYYDVVDNLYFSESATRIRNSRNRSTDLPEKYFLASARFIPEKNLARLVEAYSLYVSTHASPWNLVILGDGPLAPRLKAQIAQLNLGGLVHLPGFAQYPQLPQHYAFASAFVHPSVSEPWGLVVNEAMACGLPVLVSSRCGCAADLVEEGGNGLSFDPFDTKKLSEHLLDFATGKYNLSAMGQRSAEIISEWTPEKFAESLWQAARVAADHGMPETTLLDKCLLKLLLCR